MASAYLYTWTRQDGTTVRAWRARWTGADGRTSSRRGFALKREAEAYAADREAEARHGIALAASPASRVTVEQWASTWMRGLDVRRSTRQAYGYAVNRITAGLGRRPLAALRPSEIRSWRRALGDRLAPSTVDLTASVLAMMLRAATDDGLIDRSPMPKRGVGRTTGRIVDPDELLTLDQVLDWAAAMPPAATEMPLVAAMTGLRQGELLGLRLDNVDFLRRTIGVVEQLQPVAGGGVGFVPPKTRAGVRVVPLPVLAADALARHLERFPSVAGEPVFRSARGRRWTRGSFGEVWRPAKVRAGLPDWAHWHALRDVAASTWIRQGVDVRTVMVLLGHASSEETLRTYARLWPDARDVARRAMEVAWDSTRHGRATDEGHRP